MDLNEYVKQSYTRPNKAVLEALNASEELVGYLLHTPWNTNMSMVDSIASQQENIWFKTTLTAEDYEHASEGKIQKQLEILADDSMLNEVLDGSVADFHAVINNKIMLSLTAASGGAFSFYDSGSQTKANIRVTYDNYQGSQDPEAYIVINVETPIIGEVKVKIIKNEE